MNIRMRVVMSVALMNILSACGVDAPVPPFIPGTAEHRNWLNEQRNNGLYIASNEHFEAPDAGPTAQQDHEQPFRPYPTFESEAPTASFFSEATTQTDCQQSFMQQVFSLLKNKGGAFGRGVVVTGVVALVGHYAYRKFNEYRVTSLCDYVEKTCKQFEAISQGQLQPFASFFNHLSDYKRENLNMLDEADMRNFIELLPAYLSARLIMNNSVRQMHALYEREEPRLTEKLKQRLISLHESVAIAHKIVVYMEALHIQSEKYCSLYNVRTRIYNAFIKDLDTSKNNGNALEVCMKQLNPSSNYYVIDYAQWVNNGIHELQDAVNALEQEAQWKNCGLVHSSRNLLNDLSILYSRVLQHSSYADHLKRREEARFAQQKINELERAHREQEHLKRQEILLKEQEVKELRRTNDLVESQKKLIEKRNALLRLLHEHYKRLQVTLEHAEQRFAENILGFELRAILEELHRLDGLIQQSNP